MIMREDYRYSNPPSSSNIAYWNRDEWSKFIKDSIIPLHDHAKKLLNFYSYICNFNNQPVNKVFEKWPGAEKALLGGVEFDENNYQALYSERSLAKIYKSFFGFFIDITAYYNYKIQGLQPVIPCIIEKLPETTVDRSLRPYIIIKRIYELTSQIINLAIKNNLIGQHTSNTNIDDLITEPEKITDDLYDFFINKYIPIVVGSNDYMNFVWSIRKITRKYLYILYPELKDKNKLESIKEILGLNTLFKPKIGDEKFKEDYEILGFRYLGRHLGRYEEPPDTSLGGLLCQLNLYILATFSITKYSYGYDWNEYDPDNSLIKCLRLIVQEPILLYNVYLEAIDKELKANWSPSPIVSKILDECKNYPNYCEKPILHVSGALIDEIIEPYKYQPRSIEHRINAPLFIVLDNLMTAVSLGKYEIVFWDQERFSVFEYNPDPANIHDILI
jgi:hypothetical protein